MLSVVTSRPARSPDIRPAPLSTVTLTGVAEGLAASADVWRPHRPPIADHHRGYARLLATERYEAWLLWWAADQHVDPHDHGDSVAVVTAVDGELDELRFDGPLPRRRRLTVGGTLVVPPGTVHDIVARTAATSIHVYSPPLASMGYYDATGRRRLRVEPVVSDEPVVAHPAVSHHPAATPLDGGRERG